MRTFILLIALVSIVSAVDVTVGDVQIVIPTCESHLAVAHNTKQFSFLESATPPISRFLYLEAPPALSEKANADEVIELDDYNVIQSFREAESMDFDQATFLASRDVMADGFRQTLKSTSWNEIQETLNARIAAEQGVQAGIKIGTPTMVGEVEITDCHLRFTMMLDVAVADKTYPMICRGTVRSLRNRLLYLFSYKHYQDQNSLMALERMHAAFVSRLIIANPDALIIPDVATIPDAAPDAVPPTKPGEPIVP